MQIYFMSRKVIDLLPLNLFLDIKHRTLSTSSSVDTAYSMTSFDETTLVEFASVSSDIVRAYVKTGEPM